MPEITFNPNDIPASDYTPLPGGWYLVAALSSQLKNNKKGTGEYLEFCFQVLEGLHKGRRVYGRFTWSHTTSPQAVEIGHRQFAELCVACGLKGELTKTEELHSIPVKVEITVEETDFGQSNGMRRFKRASGRAKPA